MGGTSLHSEARPPCIRAERPESHARSFRRWSTAGDGPYRVVSSEGWLAGQLAPRVRPAKPDAAAVEVTEREDLRSRSPSPELPAPEFPDTDPLA